MRHYVIATHGRFAEGIYSSIKIILGEQKNVHLICAYIEDDDITEQIEKTMSEIPMEDEIVVITDLFGGSVNNEMMKVLGTRKIHLVSGMNLALVMALMINQEDDLENAIRNIIQESKESIKYCNDELVTIEEEDF